MKIKTAELKGRALDWALADALGFGDLRQSLCDRIEVVKLNNDGDYEWYAFYHTDPALCLGLMKEYRANIDQAEHAPKVQVTIWYEITDSDGEDFDAVSAIGDTIEQAVARCVVAMRLGDEVEVPSELCEVRS